MTLRLTFLAALAAAGALAQSILVYSEFQRVDPFGKVLPADKAEVPREILSPGLAHNAFQSFQVAVSVPAGQPYSLYLAQNPENSVRVVFYRPHYVKLGGVWLPDSLEPVTLSEMGQIPDVPLEVPGQTVRTLWMDLWVRPNAPVRRTRLELQLNSADRWIIYPLELRILAPAIPEPAGPLEPLGALTAPASESAAGPLRAYLCGWTGKAEEGPLNERRLIRRNARQDIALARALELKMGGKDALVPKLLEVAGLGEAKAWCSAPPRPTPLGAEWYLKVRDYLYRTSGNLR